MVASAEATIDASSHNEIYVSHMLPSLVLTGR